MEQPIEEKARATYEAAAKQYNLVPRWEQLEEETRDAYRDEARGKGSILGVTKIGGAL